MEPTIIMEKRDSHGFVVLKPSAEEINFMNAAEFRKLLFPNFDGQSLKIALDLSSVGYMNSSGIGAMIACQKKMMGLKGLLVVFNVPERIMSLLILSTLYQFFKIVDEEASLALWEELE